jgi:hypothetical protein
MSSHITYPAVTLYSHTANLLPVLVMAAFTRFGSTNSGGPERLAAGLKTGCPRSHFDVDQRGPGCMADTVRCQLRHALAWTERAMSDVVTW